MKNKLVMAIAVAAVMAALVIAPNAMATNTETGNGAQSGSHYTLNLIGKDKTDILPDDYNSGHRIFVGLGSAGTTVRSKIYLYEAPAGESFAVLDGDATDGRGAFQLPAPNNVYDELGNYVGPGAYKVYIRPLGKPGGHAVMTTCATYTYTVTNPDGTTTTISEEVCSTSAAGPVNVTLDRNKGNSKFTDVTEALTTVTYYDVILGTYVTVDIFDPALQDYFWQYDNNGMKIVQLRFYPTT